MEYIWEVLKESGGYSGTNGRTEATERLMLGFENDYYKYYNNRKTYFLNRKDAEDYIRPIAKKAFDLMIEDMKSNLDEEDEEDENITVNIYIKRGFQEIKQDELKEDNPLYELYHSDDPKTLFTCPCEYEDDRIGMYFAQVIRVKVY